VETVPEFQRFVAMGDSQTEGVGDPTGPGGTERGWADRFAEEMAARQGSLLYANLAVRGRRIAEIEEEQLDITLAMEPDLVSLIAGLNDVIRPGCDVDAVLARMDSMQSRLAATGTTILTITYPDPAGMSPVGRLLSEATIRFNEGLREVAARHGALLLDIDEFETSVDERLWCDDRLHLNSEGHRRLARGMASLVDPEVSDSEWLEDLEPIDQRPLAHRLAGEARWAGAFLAPWIWRRLTGKSSGDGRVAKRPELSPVAEAV